MKCLENLKNNQTAFRLPSLGSTVEFVKNTENDTSINLECPNI